jgi:hypothetical protein
MAGIAENLRTAAWFRRITTASALLPDIARIDMSLLLDLC